MEVFVRVVEANSFSRAADLLHISRTSVTIIVKNLEAHLRVPLLQRTTRMVKLTPEGEEYYEHALRILAEVSDMETMMGGAGNGPRGKLRVSMPAIIGKWLVTRQLHKFHTTYPDIALTLSYCDRWVDLIGEGVDCAVLAGELESSSFLVGRRLADMQRITVATPDYLRRYGQPENIEDLKNHQTLQYVSSRTARPIDLSFLVGAQCIEVPAVGKLSFDDVDAYVECGLTGLGILQPPRFMLEEHLHLGSFVEILPQWKPKSLPVSAVYPQNRHLPSKVKVFLEWITKLFEQSDLFALEDRSRKMLSMTTAVPGLPPAGESKRG
ncbi:LysR family transcriptional regulator [Cupriavidus sp. YR651]|uniref:LysR family transcriptional regulator n=1 Tax=Cupriavidus sp. YR651 TaxID=1855315 RepID=UPI0015A187B4|nr:LysR family transcriptional regulator [Cupriavidus sp. YR651]